MTKPLQDKIQAQKAQGGSANLVEISESEFNQIKEAIEKGQKELKVAEYKGEITLWRKLDHIAIYVMIAGTFMPLCIFYLDGFILWAIIGLQWICVLFGIWLKLYRFEISKKLNVAIYLTQGWMGIIPIYYFWIQMSLITFLLLVAGGLLYSIGAIIYQLEKPNPIPGLIGAHEIWHILIIIAAICHYIVISITFH